MVDTRVVLFHHSVLYCTVLYCTVPGHGVVDGGHEGEHVRGRVADHVPGQRPPRPELLVPPVNVFHLNIFTLWSKYFYQII